MADQAEQVGSMSEAGRIAGIFWEPRPVFEDLAERPRWWVPLILLTALSLVLVVTLSRVVGWESVLRQQMESNSRLAQMPAEQRERGIEMGLKFASISGYVGAAVGVTVSTLLIAAVMLGSLNLLGGAKLKYRQAFSVTCYSFLPTGLSTIMIMVVMFLKDPAEFSLQNALPVHLGAFLNPQTTVKWLYTLASSFNLFTIWVILLMALGLSVASRKLTFGKSLTLVALPWAVFVLLTCAVTAMFS
jgi:hypothetical protein